MVKKRAQDIRDEDVADMMIKKALDAGHTQYKDGSIDRISFKEITRIKIRDICFKGKTIANYPKTEIRSRLGRKITYLKLNLKHIDKVMAKFIPDIKDYRLTHPNAIVWLQINNSLQPNIDKMEKQIQDYLPWFAIPLVKKMFQKLFEQVAIICEADNFWRSIGLLILMTIDDVFEEKRVQWADDIRILEVFIREHPDHEQIEIVKIKLHNMMNSSWKQEMIEYTLHENVAILNHMEPDRREAGEKRARERLAKEKDDGKH